MVETVAGVEEVMVIDQCLESLDKILARREGVYTNLSRAELIEEIVENREAQVLPCGALATWTPAHSTGRSPKDTYIVQHPESHKKIDWSSPNNNPIAVETFDQLWADGVEMLKQYQKIYVSDRVVGADAAYALPTRVVSTQALSVLFADNMFRPIPADVSKSVYSGDGLTLLALPRNILDTAKYKGKLSGLRDGAHPLLIALDVDRKLVLVIGSRYQGTVKKAVFTMMNYLLPDQGILPLHCSANEGRDGSTALFLGLSGTGKTTLSSDASRALIGDDEHGWSNTGIANFENGCYAKLIHLNREKEPDIYDATFHEAEYTSHGSIIENAMVFPDGSIDLHDSRYTENSRVSYPLTSLKNVKEGSCGGHPKQIIFLTADANGVLPPVAKLSRDQARLWFLMGYTSKLAGTETGITEPVSAFSRFFGGPFMPRVPSDYIELFGEKIDKFGTSVYLVNTGWTGGPYGVGKRFDINATRYIVHAILNGSLDNVEYENNSLFHIQVPKSCPNVDASILNPMNTWSDKAAYEARAQKLAGEFSAYFDKAYGSSNLDTAVRSQCPGK